MSLFVFSLHMLFDRMASVHLLPRFFRFCIIVVVVVVASGNVGRFDKSLARGRI